MNLKEVIGRSTTPPPDDQPTHFQYQASRIVASIATQAFSYMIQGNVQYGYITTGQAFVFLHVPQHDPGTLYYHLAEPEADVEAQGQSDLTSDCFLYRTAIGQCWPLAFWLWNQPPVSKSGAKMR